ncbi:hypothetical protein SKAU_G00235300 [Synaphobranchus kaupii]|uniref:Alkylated DNA repair protein AlkB homologue 8 N-terminal domain-containing protein n=1 Tax=Synaphobranchus kaupii TaxID=118154 RepID=A0A9Q1F6H6_SYNKA|nr:hypothetical protein SKAU_G00235300 [Synaphobranchus kaupii]
METSPPTGRTQPPPPPPITLDNSPVATVDSFHFLGTIISRDLKWELNISSLIKKAQQRMFFLRQLKKFNLPRTMMVQFYTSIIESTPSPSLPGFLQPQSRDKTRLRRVIRSAERVIGCDLPFPPGPLHDSRALKRARKIIADPSHPGHGLFSPLPPRQEAAVDKN